EARRAAKEGRTPPPAPEEQPFETGTDGMGSEGRSEPEAEAEAGPVTAVPEPPTLERTKEPPATAKAWRQVAGTPEPDPPMVRRVQPGTTASPALEPDHEAHAALPEPARTEEPPRRIPPAPPLPFDGD